MQSLAQRLEKGGVLSCTSISAAAQSFLAALLRYLFPQRAIVVVTEGLRTQESAQQDLTTWLAVQGGIKNEASPSPQPLFYPAWEVFPHEERLPHADVISERLETLIALTQHATRNTHHAPLIVTSVAALLQRTFPVEAVRERTRTLTRGDRIDPLDLVEWLEAEGYEPEARVTQKGEIALRGGILDIYPLTCPWPVRMEFFGDELESLRQFDPLTQISREEIKTITIPPAGELGLLKRMRTAECGVRNEEPQTPTPDSQPSLGTLLDYLPAETILLLCEPAQLAERAEEYGTQVPNGDIFFIAWESFLARAKERGMTLLEVTEAESDAIPLEYDEGGETSPDAPFPLTPALSPEEREKASTASDNAEPGRIYPVLHQAFPLPAAGGRGERKAIVLNHTPLEAATAAGIPHSALPTPQFLDLEAFRPLPERAPEAPVAEAQRREFFAQLHRWLRQDYAVHVFCNNAGEQQRFTEIWKEYGLAQESPKTEAQRPQSSGTPGLWTLDSGLWTHLGTLGRGFLCNEARVVVVTDAEIFGRYKVQRPRRLKSPHAQATRSALDIDFTELEEGDYVVHVQHGIGRYLGLQVLPLSAGTKPTEGTGAIAHQGQECLVIEYAPSDPSQQPPKLYVPVTEAHLVGKYVGTGKARPPLNTLGGVRWAKAKEHAERAVRDVASDLLAIQAARESQAGHPFAPDAPWQREFESAFIFQETPDQERAIVETKADMERPKPMDRLICGDVGFGKTEVGIRAAFKAVMDGKQVAVLVPTTVLAQQHYNTFRERMADYPIRVELLSRFRTRRAQDGVIRDLAAGAVDIVIGTHRLLQADIAIKDLGLVVIDEEQRFGVMHMEKFTMQLRLVDVLTLSATPIPRTLYLALTGARDMSTIQTPPHDRLPVETIVTAYDERLIRDAIQRELNRGGQVFFLHNRVFT
ncbi:MAG: DEAD/DEAH box helicase, partial [Verrucomicrobia bacterium]|nr:DEAD/DEAH box helicase [Verrucomicrobiota bacterium]